MKVLILILFFSFSVQAETIRLVQAGKTFLGDITDEQANVAYDDPTIEEKYKVVELKIKTGDTLVFANRDEVSHNVSAKSGDDVLFNVDLQRPGKKNDKEIVIDKKGEYEIKCAIHPKMMIKLKVD